METESTQMRSRERKNTSIVDDIAHSLSQNRRETKENKRRETLFEEKWARWDGIL